MNRTWTWNQITNQHKSYADITDKVHESSANKESCLRIWCENKRIMYKNHMLNESFITVQLNESYARITYEKESCGRIGWNEWMNTYGWIRTEHEHMVESMNHVYESGLKRNESFVWIRCDNKSCESCERITFKWFIIRCEHSLRL